MRSWPTANFSLFFFYQDGIVMWRPNDTIWNRLRQRYNMGIDASNAQRLQESLKEYILQTDQDVETEINIKTTSEMVKQMHETMKTQNEPNWADVLRIRQICKPFFHRHHNLFLLILMLIHCIIVAMSGDHLPRDCYCLWLWEPSLLVTFMCFHIPFQKFIVM